MHGMFNMHFPFFKLNKWQLAHTWSYRVLPVIHRKCTYWECNLIPGSNLNVKRVSPISYFPCTYPSTLLSQLNGSIMPLHTGKCKSYTCTPCIYLYPPWWRFTPIPCILLKHSRVLPCQTAIAAITQSVNNNEVT